MSDAQTLFEQLLKAESENEADTILRRAGYWAKKKAGRPVPRRPKLAAFKGPLQ